jgi:hypothetical protein
LQSSAGNAMSNLQSNIGTTGNIISLADHKLHGRTYRCNFCMKVFECAENFQQHLKMHKQRFMSFLKNPQVQMKKDQPEDTLSLCNMHPELVDDAASFQIPDGCDQGNTLSTSQSSSQEEDSFDQDNRLITLQSSSQTPEGCDKGNGLIAVQSHTDSTDNAFSTLQNKICKSTINIIPLVDKEKHVRTLRKRSYTCAFCMEVFECSQTFRLHVKIHETPYVCIICQERFTTSQQCDFHVTKHLTERKSYICDICKKVFESPAKLSQHLRTHTHTCDVCEREFTSASELRNHLLTHPGEKPYICVLCNKGFTYNSRYKHHVQSHMG